MADKKKKYENSVRLEGWIDCNKLELRTAGNTMPFMYFTLNHPTSAGGVDQYDCRINHTQAVLFSEAEKGKGVQWFFVNGGLIKSKDANNGSDKMIIQVKLIGRTYRK